jgi:hypothetical protein
MASDDTTLVAVTLTEMYFPVSAVTGTYSAATAPEMVRHQLGTEIVFAGITSLQRSH